MPRERRKTPKTRAVETELKKASSILQEASLRANKNEDVFKSSLKRLGKAVSKASAAVMGSRNVLRRIERTAKGQTVDRVALELERLANTAGANLKALDWIVTRKLGEQAAATASEGMSRKDWQDLGRPERRGQAGGAGGEGGKAGQRQGEAGQAGQPGQMGQSPEAGQGGAGGQGGRGRETLDEIKKRLMNKIGHELKTPLTSIQGSQSLLKSEIAGNLSEEAMELVETAERNTTRLVTMVNQILETELEELKGPEVLMTSLSLKKVMARAMAGLPRGRKLEVRAEGDLGTVFGREIRITHVMAILITSALEIREKGKKVVVSAVQEGRGRLVRVFSPGAGIEAGYLPHVFEPFFQLDDSNSRLSSKSGLELALCKTILEHHSGRIGVKNTSSGSIFWFWLPDPSAKTLKHR